MRRPSSDYHSTETPREEGPSNLLSVRSRPALSRGFFHTPPRRPTSKPRGCRRRRWWPWTPSSAVRPGSTTTTGGTLRIKCLLAGAGIMRGRRGEATAATSRGPEGRCNAAPDAGGSGQADGWWTRDTDSDNFEGTLRQGAVLDQAMSALLADLEPRGLLMQTLVVLGIELGRTPRINENDGRGHRRQLNLTRRTVAQHHPAEHYR